MATHKAKINHPPAYIQKQIRPAIERNDLSAEVVWTYLLAKKYQNDPTLLAGKLCGHPEKMPEGGGIWLETYLAPTRQQQYEQNSWKIRADLAIGYVKPLKGRVRQIMAGGNWICVVESKWFDDIHSNAKFPEVNQLAQLIEHALLLHDEKGSFPERVYVTLLTPAYFMQPHAHFLNKMYFTKYHEYNTDKMNLISDLRTCTLPYDSHGINTILERIEHLILNWLSFDNLLNLPDLVKARIPDKYETNRQTWEQIASETNQLNILEELRFCQGKTGVFQLGETGGHLTDPSPPDEL